MRRILLCLFALVATSAFSATYSSLEQCQAGIRAAAPAYKPHVTASHKLEDLRKRGFEPVEFSRPTCVHGFVYDGKPVDKYVILSGKWWRDPNPSGRTVGYMDQCANAIYAVYEDVAPALVPVVVAPPPAPQATVVTQYVCVGTNALVSKPSDCVPVAAQVPVVREREIVFAQAPATYAQPSYYYPQQPYYQQQAPSYGGGPFVVSIDNSRVDNSYRDYSRRIHYAPTYYPQQPFYPQNPCGMNPLGRSCSQFPTQYGTPGTATFPRGNLPIQTGGPGGSQGANPGRVFWR